MCSHPPPLPTSDAHAIPLQLLSRYRVIGRLGSGAFADVVRLRPTAGGPDVALKVLRPGAPHPAGVPPEVALFREARALKHAGAHT